MPFMQRVFKKKILYFPSRSIQILPYLMETPVPNTFYHSDIFNDSAIHWFPTEKLASVPQALWRDNDEPVYDANDPEIVTTSERT